MDSRDVQSKAHNTILDLAGKLVGGFGLILGLGYISGWVYLYSYYAFFGAAWALNFYDAQAFIQIGLLWVVYCSTVAGLVFICFKKVDHIRSAGIGIFFVGALIFVTLSFLLSLFGYHLEDLPGNRFLGPALMGTASSFCIAAALRAAFDQGSLRFVLASTAFGFVWMVVANPWMYAYTKILDMKSRVEEQVLVIGKDSGIKALLLGVASGKLILIDCATHQFYIIEPDDKIIFKEGNDLCK